MLGADDMPLCGERGLVLELIRSRVSGFGYLRSLTSHFATIDAVSCEERSLRIVWNPLPSFSVTI